MKLDRLLGILVALLRRERITAPELAKRFEVSRRTISRDIDALCQAGIPVVTQQGAGGGISIAEGYKLDKTLLTKEELSNMIAAVKGIGSVTDKAQTDRVLDKLIPSISSNAVEDQSVHLDLGAYHKDTLTEKIALIRQAITDGQMVRFVYLYEKGEMTREIEPYYVCFRWHEWYLFGFCNKRKDFRLFKLMRLWDIKLLNKHFEKREIPADKRELSPCFLDDKKMIAVFHPSEKYRLVETYGQNCYTELEDGYLRAEIRYANTAFTLSWLLCFGDRVKVLEPESLAREIKRIAEQIVRQYS